MKKERKKIKLEHLYLNEGQLDWLPKNPRQWTQTDIDRTKASLTEDPDFLEDRPVLVVPFDSDFIVFAHNLCTHSAKLLEWKDVPAVIYYPETDDDRLTVKRRAIKDNGSYGSNDYDALANEWDDMPLEDWGLSVWDFSKKKENSSKPTGEMNLGDIDVTYDIQVTCASLEEQIELIKELDNRGYKCKSL